VRQLLIVDDEEPVRQTISQIFAGRFEVVPASNGVEALRLLAERAISVAIVDLRLPGDFSDVDLIAKIRNDHPGVPVIILTAAEDFDSVLAAWRFGCADYLVKPSDVSLMMRAVEAALTPPLHAPAIDHALRIEVDSLRDQVARHEQMLNSKMVKAAFALLGAITAIAAALWTVLQGRK
jgi:two-component system nitrogen regulation response regulator GlnG